MTKGSSREVDLLGNTPTTGKSPNCPSGVEWVGVGAPRPSKHLRMILGWNGQKSLKADWRFSTGSPWQRGWINQVKATRGNCHLKKMGLTFWTCDISGSITEPIWLPPSGFRAAWNSADGSPPPLREEMRNPGEEPGLKS